MSGKKKTQRRTMCHIMRPESCKDPFRAGVQMESENLLKLIETFGGDNNYSKLHQKSILHALQSEMNTLDDQDPLKSVYRTLSILFHENSDTLSKDLFLKEKEKLLLTYLLQGLRKEASVMLEDEDLVESIINSIDALEEKTTKAKLRNPLSL